MKRAVVLAALAALLAGCGGGGVRTVTVTTTVERASSLAPECPAPSYGADGALYPLFCQVDSPRALRFYGSLVRPLLALGRGATPGEVAAALQSERGSAGPTTWLCNAYALAARAEHWHFGASPAQLVTNDSCVG